MTYRAVFSGKVVAADSPYIIFSHTKGVLAACSCFAAVKSELDRETDRCAESGKESDAVILEWRDGWRMGGSLYMPGRFCDTWAREATARKRRVAESRLRLGARILLAAKRSLAAPLRDATGTAKTIGEIAVERVPDRANRKERWLGHPRREQLG